MMAKMFYTLEETKASLGRSEEEIKQLTREGRLREFRDGARLMFKADQVDQLRGDLEHSSDAVDLGPSDTGAPIGLADSAGPSGTGSGLTLTDDGGGRSPGAGMTLKDDTALAADLGLSGSLGGMPSPSRTGSGSGTGLSGMSSAGRSGSGISVFSADEVDHADPSAQTAISPGVNEQMNLEGVGSGSGLLDLTRESDDTSLGAELLDEIEPGAARGGIPSDSIGGTPSLSGLTSSSSGSRSVGMPLYVEAHDAMAPAIGGAALGAAAVVSFGIFVLISALMNTWPPFVKDLQAQSLWVLAGGGLGLAIVLFIIGIFVGKAGAGRH